MVTFGLYSKNGTVYKEEEEQSKPFTDFPTTVVVEAVDFGQGWHVEGDVLDVFRCDAGSGHVNYAVTVRVPTPEAFVALEEKFEVLTELPERL